MGAADAARLRNLETENNRLMNLLAEAHLAIKVLSASFASKAMRARRRI